MALKDLMKSVGDLFSRVAGDSTRRPDGGTSHYRPLRKKTAEPQIGETMQGQDMGQDPRFVHTGFTGMNPPANYGYEGQGSWGQTAYDQTAFGQTGYAQASYSRQGNNAQQVNYPQQVNNGQTVYQNPWVRRR